MSHNWMLSEKTRIPSAREHTVIRARLESRLRLSLDARLTTVTAPAGFGKTTAVSDWITRNRIRATWVSLKEGDDAKLWHYAAFAVEKLIPGYAQRLQPILDGRDPVSPEFLIAHMIQELHKNREPFILVFDDYHLIKTPAVHDSLHINNSTFAP